MKYLGAIVDDKDLVNKEYVDKAVPPHKKVYPHTQTFTATAAGSAWTYTIPWDEETPSLDELFNFNAYHYVENYSNTLISGAQMDKYSVSVSSGSIRYVIVFYTSTVSGQSTIVFQNSFTDSDGTISSGM